MAQNTCAFAELKNQSKEVKSRTTVAPLRGTPQFTPSDATNVGITDLGDITNKRLGATVLWG
jgi:hypothetical protein